MNIMMGNFGREIIWREIIWREIFWREILWWENNILDLIPFLFTKFTVITLISDMTPTTPIAKEPVAQVH